MRVISAIPQAAEAWPPLAALLAGGLPQSMLCVGPWGSGVVELTDLFLDAMLCLAPRSDQTACGQCRSCILQRQGVHPDLLRLQAEEEGKLIGIDQVRAAADFLSYTPQIAARRVLRVEPAEALAPAAANAFLKTLEEPPPRSHIVLLSAAPSRLLPTIRSRLQRLPMRLAGRAETQQWLREKGVPESAAARLARWAGDRPLWAWQAWQDGVLREREQWIPQLLALPHEGIGAALALAESWSKAATLPVLREIALSILEDLLRLRLGLVETLVNDDYITKLQSLAGSASPGALWSCEALWRKLPVTLKQNRNQLILLEDMIFAWYAIWAGRTKEHGRSA